MRNCSIEPQECVGLNRYVDTFTGLKMLLRSDELWRSAISVIIIHDFAVFFFAFNFNVRLLYVM